MFNLFKKEEPTIEVNNTQPEDWTKEIKRNQLIGSEAEQMSFTVSYTHLTLPTICSV